MGRQCNFSFPDDTTIGKVMFDIGKSNEIAPLEQLKFIYKGKPLETLGLSNPIKTFEDDGKVNIHIVLRLSAAPYSLGKLRLDYWSFVISVLEKGNFTNGIDTQIKTFYRYLNELEYTYKNAWQKESINNEDPITLEDITNGFFWIENGKKFSMNYYSLIEYMNKFKYVDENGITQIPNPFTQEPISDPWRTDFLDGLH